MSTASLVRALSNIPGWRTRRKIVVIESDDWGSIRMPSLEVYNKLRALGINVSSGDNDRFNTLDTLASKTDFDALFETLSSFVDNKGNHPVFTALSLCANPDFDKIRQSDFTEYHYEPFTTTLKRYGLNGAFEKWEEGYRNKVFHPEFHGREHLNVRVWLNDLSQGDKHARIAFDHGFWGFRNRNESNISYQAAFDVDDNSSLVSHKGIIEDGLILFKKIHGRPARYFVPPNGAINQEIIDFSVSKGIQYVSSPKIHKEPLGKGRTRNRYRYLGMSSANKFLYLTRNCFFESSFRGKGFTAIDCLAQIQSAFTFWKPAVISTHRVNYVGGLSEQNRTDGNRALRFLLDNIQKKWPEVEFMTSTQLAELIAHDQK